MNDEYKAQIDCFYKMSKKRKMKEKYHPILKLKEKAILLKQNISTLYYASKNPKLPLRAKCLIIFIIGYTMSPIDLIPDFIPILGYLDDIIIIPFLIAIVIKMIPNDILIDSKNKAKEQKLSLKKNWVFGVVFILIWALIILKLISFVISKI